MLNSAIEFLYSTLKRFPHKRCLEDEQMQLDFKEFFERAFALSEALGHAKNLNRPVMVYLPKSAQAVIAFAGILLSGNFYVPVDIKSPRRRLISIIENIKPHRVVTSQLYKQEVSSLGIDSEKLVFVDMCEHRSPKPSIDEMIEHARFNTDNIIDTDPCYVMYTSGSTGTPKGVVVPHRGVIDYIEWAISCLKVNEQEVIGNQAPLYFDNSTLDVYLCWATGAELILIPEKHFIFPARLVDFLEEKKVSFVFFVPSVLVNIAKMGILKPKRLPLLKKLVFAGEVMPTKHLATWQKTLPHITYINLYGPTEITVDCTYFIVDRIYEEAESLPIGYPCKNTSILILNEQNKPAEVGEQGELCVRGSSLALGYWGDHEKSNAVFTQNPLQENFFDTIYRTGDIVYKNEKGQIIFVGRKDSQIKHMGYRIELGEIESAAMTLPFVDNCCALYDKEKGEINLFCESKGEPSLRDVKKALSNILPSYMVPRRIRFMQSLPLTPNGKIDRKALAHDFS